MVYVADQVSSVPETVAASPPMVTVGELVKFSAPVKEMVTISPSLA
jgi:hypothetical protein